MTFLKHRSSARSLQLQEFAYNLRLLVYCESVRGVSAQNACVRLSTGIMLRPQTMPRSAAYCSPAPTSTKMWKI